MFYSLFFLFSVKIYIYYKKHKLIVYLPDYSECIESCRTVKFDTRLYLIGKSLSFSKILPILEWSNNWRVLKCTDYKDYKDFYNFI